MPHSSRLRQRAAPGPPTQCRTASPPGAAQPRRAVAGPPDGGPRSSRSSSRPRSPLAHRRRTRRPARHGRRAWMLHRAGRTALPAGSLQQPAVSPQSAASSDRRRALVRRQADRDSRPLRRRAARIARPARVRIRNRKPCTLARLRLFGWKVRLLTVHISSRSRYCSGDRRSPRGRMSPAPQHQHLIERRFASAGSRSRHVAIDRYQPKGQHTAAATCGCVL